MWGCSRRLWGQLRAGVWCVWVGRKVLGEGPSSTWQGRGRGGGQRGRAGMTGLAEPGAWEGMAGVELCGRAMERV